MGGKTPVLLIIKKLRPPRVTVCSATASQELIDYAKQAGKPVLDFPGETDYVAAYDAFYDKVIAG